MKTLYQDSQNFVGQPTTDPAPLETVTAEPSGGTIPPRDVYDAGRAALLAVQRALAANWEDALPRIAVMERDGVDTVYVSTSTRLGTAVRADIRGAVRVALGPYARLAPYTNVVFLTRGNP